MQKIEEKNTQKTQEPREEIKKDPKTTLSATMKVYMKKIYIYIHTHVAHIHIYHTYQNKIWLGCSQDRKVNDIFKIN